MLCNFHNAGRKVELWQAHWKRFNDSTEYSTRDWQSENFTQRLQKTKVFRWTCKTQAPPHCMYSTETCIPEDISEHRGCPEGKRYRPQEERFGRLQNKKGGATKLFNSYKSPTLFHRIPSKTTAPQLIPHYSAQVERSGMLTHP